MKRGRNAMNNGEKNKKNEKMNVNKYEKKEKGEKFIIRKKERKKVNKDRNKVTNKERRSWEEENK